MSSENYFPDGNTPLLDTIGFALVKMESYLSDKSDNIGSTNMYHSLNDSRTKFYSKVKNNATFASLSLGFFEIEEKE
jgi:hypothetical protein